MSPIRLAFCLSLSASALVAGASTAQDRPIRFTDAEYIAASRCAAWEPVARAGGGVIAARLETQKGSRLSAVQQQARQAERDARLVARRAQGQGNAAVAQLGDRFERECTRFVAG
jgi:hypothetical protein